MVVAAQVMCTQEGKGAGRQASNSAFASRCLSKVLPIVDPTWVDLSLDISQTHPNGASPGLVLNSIKMIIKSNHQGWKHQLPDFTD